MSAPTEKFSVHDEPAWRERANFIVHAALPEQRRYEQLWCRQVSDDTFEVCCIPFFLYDVALGDLVQTAPQAEREYVVAGVLRRSGRYVFRVYFAGPMLGHRESAVDQLTTMGSLLEWSSPSLLAVDARDATHAQEIATYLTERESQGHLVYETGRSA